MSTSNNIFAPNQMANTMRGLHARNLELVEMLASCRDCFESQPMEEEMAMVAGMLIVFHNRYGMTVAQYYNL